MDTGCEGEKKRVENKDNHSDLSKLINGLAINLFYGRYKYRVRLTKGDGELAVE